MSLVFTQLFDETFSGPDASPIDPTKWGQGVDPGAALQQLNHFCEVADINVVASRNYIARALPDNQYVRVKIHRGDAALDQTWGTDIEMVILANDTQTECYVLYVDSFGDGTADCAITNYSQAFDGGSKEILDFGTIPFSPDDVFMLAAVDGTLYAYKNDVFMGSVQDSTHTSGRTGLFMSFFGVGFTDIDGIQIAEFAGGMAAQDAVPATPPFLGTIVEDPTVAATAFLGTVTVIGSAPDGALNPFLGKFKVVAAPAGAPNPALGQVVVVGSVPAGVTGIEIGKIATG